MLGADVLVIFRECLTDTLGWLGPEREIVQHGQDCIEAVFCVESVAVRITVSAYEFTVYTDIGKATNGIKGAIQWIPFGKVLSAMGRDYRRANAMFATPDALRQAIALVSEELSLLLSHVRLNGWDDVSGKLLQN